MDGVGETGAETLPSLQSSGAGLGGVAYMGELAQAQARVGPRQMNGLIWAVFSAESGTRAQMLVPQVRPRKKKRIAKKKKGAACCQLHAQCRIDSISAKTKGGS